MADKSNRRDVDSEVERQNPAAKAKAWNSLRRIDGVILNLDASYAAALCNSRVSPSEKKVETPLYNRAGKDSQLR